MQSTSPNSIRLNRPKIHQNVKTSKDTIKNMKSQVRDWEKIFIIHISDKDLYPEFIKSFYNSINTVQFKPRYAVTPQRLT
jgi:hypothetical protein